VLDTASSACELELKRALVDVSSRASASRQAFFAETRWLAAPPLRMSGDLFYYHDDPNSPLRPRRFEF